MSDEYYSKYDLYTFNKPYLHKRENYVFSIAAETEAGIGPYSTVNGPDILPIIAPSFTETPSLVIDQYNLPRYVLSFGINTNGSDVTSIIISDGGSNGTDYVSITGTVGTTTVSYKAENIGTNNITLGSVVSGTTGTALSLPTPTISDTSGANKVLNFVVPLNYTNTTTSSYSFKVSAQNSAGTTVSSISASVPIATILSLSYTSTSVTTNTDTTKRITSFTFPFSAGSIIPATNTQGPSFPCTYFSLIASTESGNVYTQNGITSPITINVGYTTTAVKYTLTLTGSIPNTSLQSSVTYTMYTKGITSAPNAPTASSPSIGKIQLTFAAPTVSQGSNIIAYTVVPYYTVNTGNGINIMYDPPIRVPSGSYTESGGNITINLSTTDRTKVFDTSKLTSITSGTSLIGTEGKKTVTQPYAYVPLDNYPTNLIESYKFKHSNTSNNFPEYQVTGGYEVHIEYCNNTKYMLYIGSAFASLLLLYIIYKFYITNNNTMLKKIIFH